MLSRATSTVFLTLCVLALALTGCGGGGGAPSDFNGIDGGSDDADASMSLEGGDDSPMGPQFVGDGQTSDATPPLPDGCVGGACFDGPVCGDGIVETGETCDDGNTVPGDGCSGVCQIEPGYACPTPDNRASRFGSAATASSTRARRVTTATWSPATAARRRAR